MTHRILAEFSASISDLKKNPMEVVGSGHGGPVAVLNRNSPAFYCVPASAYEALMDHLDDLELAALVKERSGGESIAVNIDEL
ncbi:MAG: type II toxin-antitoxin system Phd/YefM family antitoxin [Chromatiales bacterium]|nr:type II toxin-antitoxin system Phd/YefM family antitoxin [Gammaproteobacteria bacterium]MCP5352257.1 type II toxin-antitoxin system Phd/YefM family antitoxin [Chromatiales bacterium]